MFNLLLTSGCSHTFGSGMINCHEFYSNREYVGTDIFLDNVIAHPKLKKFFKNLTTPDTIKKRIEELSWTSVVASELNIPNFYNLGIGGSGVDVQIRNSFSFIEENKSKLDLENALFIYKVPTLSRVEMIRNYTDNQTDMHTEDTFNFTSYNFSTPSDLENDNGLEVFINHFDFNFYISKHLFNVLLFKKYIESTGMTFLAIPDGFRTEEEYFYTIKDVDSYNKKINNFSDDMHHIAPFPSLETMIDDIGFLKMDPSNPYGTPKTLIENGYNDDYHYSPEGHKIFGKNLAHYLKKKYNI